MHLSKRNIGVNFNENGLVSINVWAPEAAEVTVEIVDSASLSLNKMDFGYWFLETDQIKAGDKYWVLLDGKRLPDPASLAQPNGVHGPSQALDLRSYTNSEVAGWTNYPLNEYIIYELHTGTFSEDGTFYGIVEHLDYLKDLGVNAIELMPVASFPGERNWGYDGVYPFAVQESYGGAEGLHALVRACHDKGIAVILDVVYNHVGPDGNYLPQFGPYFTDKYHTPWGDALNFDDNGCDAVREYFLENVLMWLRDFHIDALRLDAVHAIKDFGAVHILQEISRRTAMLMAQTGDVHYLIAESDLNDPKYIAPLSENGMGMDAQWIDEFHHALRVTAGEKRIGYYADFKGIADLVKSYADAYVYTGTFSEERNKTFGKPPIGRSGDQFITFSQNHDQIGNRMLGERSSQLLSFEMQKLVASAVFCAPFLPMIFMGEEWGAPSPFLYFVSHTDRELVELVRKGRKEEFAAMHDQGEAPDPQSEDTFERSKLDWKLLQNSPHAGLLNYYKALINLRKTQPSLNSCDRDATRVHLIEDRSCIVLERGVSGMNDLTVCVLNFSDGEQRLSVPTGIQLNQMLLNSAADEEGLAAGRPLPSTPLVNIHIQPESFIAYSATYV